MINTRNFSHWQIKLSFLYTIGIAFVIWQGNRSLFFSLRSYFDWHQKPVRKIAALLLTIVFYTVPVSVILLTGWYRIFAKGIIDWNVIITASLIIMICVVFITHVYETVFLVKESENEMIRNMELERSKAEAELEALKNQIDPHFIFNSLNTLSHLIEEKPAKARLFNDTLADVYRYILQNKGRELVLLREEVDFLKNYYALLRIRYEPAVQMELQLPDKLLDSYLIPPISLQLLLENAIKHNEFSDQVPLVIRFCAEGEMVRVQNAGKRKNQLRETSRIGLGNLDRRYRLISGKGIRIEDNNTEFLVEIPLLKIE
ncbi:MAG: histidine kinase [Chitinophagaceae bacterium]|nr:histidine kinase [Chitinophagaceae bacterium]